MSIRILILVTVFCVCGILLLESVLQVSPDPPAPVPRSHHRLYPSNLSLVDLPRFRYLINNDVCQDQSVYLMVIVTSHPANHKLRDAMRETLPQKYLDRLSVKRLFLLARAEKSQTDYKKVKNEVIQAENLENKDLLVGDFQESYRNLTYKHVMGLQWASRFCSQVNWILKMDDDIAVDLFQILEILRKKESIPMESTPITPRDELLGLLQIGLKPLRNTSSKWYVTWKEYMYPEYDTFLSGWAYLLKPKTAERLVEEATKVPYFWIDDVHVTGTLAKRLGLKRHSLNSYFTVYSELLRCCYTQPDHRKKLCDYAVGPTLGHEEVMKEYLWQARLCYHKKCTRRKKKDRIENVCIDVPKTVPMLGRGKGEVIALRL